MNILLVDDNANVLSKLLALLKPFHCEVSCAANGLDAQEKMNNTSFDLLIVDHLMPLMDGIKLLKNTRHEHSSPIVIFMTTQGSDNYQYLLRSSLCEHILDKPINNENFLALIQQINKKNTRCHSL